MDNRQRPITIAKKSQRKVRELQHFPQKLLDNRLLEILFSINKLLAIYVQKDFFSNIYGLRFFFKKLNQQA